MNDQLHTTVRRLSSSAAVIDIFGELNAYSEDSLMDAYTMASNGRTGAIILNFTDLEYMNSSGIGLLVTLLIRVQRQNQKMLAFGLNDHYREIFELTRLNEAIEIFESEKEALTAITAQARA